MSSYDNLLKQVEALKNENCHLRQELQDNSSHLTKLESEASTMKNVLSHLHTAMEDDDTCETCSETSSIHGDLPSVDNYHHMEHSTDSLDLNSNSADSSIHDPEWSQPSTQIHTPTDSQAQTPSNPAQVNQNLCDRIRAIEGKDDPDLGNDSPDSPGSPASTGSPQSPRSPIKPSELSKGNVENSTELNFDPFTRSQMLDKERHSLLQEMENEESHRKWYFEQLEALEKKLRNFPQSDTFNMQKDMARRQLEYEVERVRSMMQENLGTPEQAAQRHQALIQRIQLIENEMIQLQQRHHQQLQQEDFLVTGHADVGTEAGHISSEVSFVEASYHELQGDLPDGTLLYNGPNGSKLVTIATQTAEELLQLERATNTYDGNRDHRGSSNQNFASLYHGAWPLHGTGGATEGSLAAIANQDTASVMSFHSNNTSSTSFSRAAQHQLGTKVEMVYSLLSMLGTHDKDDMSRTLLAMSSSQDSCIAMRQSGCLPLLIQLLHGNDKDSGLLGNTRGSKAARARAAAALHNIVHSHPDDKRGRREARVLRLLEQIRAHCDQLRVPSEEESETNKQTKTGSISSDIDHHPGPAIAALMKLSFDEEHRHAICTLGGLQAIAELLQLDHEVNSNTTEQYNITMRRYACMALTNLTFGDGTNKALLCSMTSAMHALVAQLQSINEDLRQVAASVLRNLSWRADLASKKTLREVGSVTALMLAAMEVSKESTLKSILSALWNMSAHCSENKADICAVEGSLGFLVSSLTFKSPSKTLSIIENGGGILRNVSSHIAVREDYRKVIRAHGCLQILLKHLRSPSLTIVSNACGTLWNLSARCLDDQKTLWEMGAISMLRNLVHSKHKMISMGSAAALKNLLSARPNLGHIEGDRLMPTNRPGLHVRRQKALETEIDQNLSETCENLESPTGSPTEVRKNDPVKHKFILSNDGHSMHGGENDRIAPPRALAFMRGGSADNSPLVEHRLHSPSRGVTRSGSQDSVGSTHSDISHDRGRSHNNIANGNRYYQERPENLKQNAFHLDMSLRGDRSGYNSQSGGSRMMKVMQEVAHSSDYTGSPHGMNDSGMMRPQMNNSQDGGRLQLFKGQHQKTKDKNIFANKLNGSIQHKEQITFCSQQMETMHLDMPEQDEPINYSMKYSSEDHRPNNQLNVNQSSAFVRPLAKVQNYIGPCNEPRFQKPPVNCVPAHVKEQKRSAMDKKIDNGSRDSPKSFPGYAETDLDNDAVDQPTDFSIRYMEQDDDGQPVPDKPINYSTRFQEQETFTTRGEGKSANRPVAPDAAILDEDTIQTFCTEGTPLTFLSTATSMNDLTAIGDKKSAPTEAKSMDKERDKKPQPVRNQYKYAESDKFSGTGTQSTGMYSGSVSTIRENDKGKMLPPDNLPPRPAPDSQPPSLYSYNDSTSASSPSDRLKAYCTEGTPMSFSRRSSLSSLQSGDICMATKKDDMTLQEMDDMDKMDASSADVTLKPEHHEGSFQSSDTSSNVHGKSVTFDDNNQIHETPMMFSRCSSLGSLSSFDAHSIHSSVVSDYSRRASEVVSPSELPDSPSDTMPPSPSNRKSPVRFEENQGQAERKSDKQEKIRELKLDTIPEGAELTRSMEMHRPIALYPEETRNYAEEEDNFSCATSLSALTFDDEPNIQKDPGLRIVPLGQENITQYHSTSIKEQVRQDEPEKEELSFDDEDDDNSSVSEGEENLLAEFISQAMPTNSKKKIKKSSSDGVLKNKDLPYMQVKPLSRIPTSASAGALAMRNSRLPMPNRPVPRLHGNVLKPDPLMDGQDSPRKFATEGTPLNYSRAESLSDLSMDDEGSGIDKTMDTVINVQAHRRQPQDVDDHHSDVSSISDDDEDLLSEAIEAAMPKNGKKKTKDIDRTAEGCDAKDHPRYQGMRRPNQQPVNNVSQHHHHGLDTVRTFAVEDTPVSLSHATSFSDLTVDDMPEADGASEGGLTAIRGTTKPNTVSHNQNTHNNHHGENSLDSTRVFVVEDTPAVFSRADSSSSLSCDEELFEELIGPKMSLAEEVAQIDKSHKKGRIGKTVSPRKPDPEETAIARLKTPGKPLYYGPSSTSTPITKKIVSTSHSVPLNEDLPRTFMTEDTPMCFSRNSSLSSLSTGDHFTAHHNQMQRPTQQSEIQLKDMTADYKVEDTPANLSGNSSLSALSVESLSFEDTPSESALLDECINAALPKSKKKAKSPSHHTSPNDEEKAISVVKKTARATLFSGLQQEVEKQQSKKAQGPQAEIKEKTENKTEPLPEKLKKSEDIIYLEGEEENGSDVDPDKEDEKLIETIQEVESKVADFDFKNAEPSDRERCLEAREIPKHLLHHMSKPNQLRTSLLGKSLEFSTGVPDMDLMKESFPDMSCSLVSNVTTPDGDELPADVGSGGQSTCDTTINSTMADNTVIFVNGVHDDTAYPENDTLYSNKYEPDEDFSVDTFIGDDIHEISVEEEKALEENAHIILSEISKKSDMVLSLLDDEMFIENETISLVSNDYTSDTASEASVSFASEHASEASSATLSESSNATRVITKPIIVQGPRIVKPVTKDTLVQQQKSETPKGIRGGKKLASAAIRGVSKPATSTAQSTPIKGVRGGAQQKSPAGRGSPAGVQRKTPPTKGPVKSPAGRGIARVGAPNVKSSPPRSSSTPPKTSQVTNSPKSSPNPSRRSNSTGRQITPPKTPNVRAVNSQGSGIPRPGQKNSPKNQTGKSPKDLDAERPAPPIKQGTFTKDSPTEAEITPEIDHNGNTPGEKRQSLADKKSPVSKLSKPEAGPSSVRSPGRSVPKASSAGSLNKTNSNSSLNKSMNNNNRGMLQRAQSAKGESPIRRGSAGTAQTRSSTPSSRSSTPNRAVTPTSRPQSANSRLNTTSRQNSESISLSDTSVSKPKKQTISKIAGLWKKDSKKSVANGDAVKEKRSDSVGSDGKPSKSAMKKLAKLGKSKKDKCKDLTVDVTIVDDDHSFMKRSSTYDKLTPDTPEVASQAHEATSSGDNISTPSLQSLEVPDEKSLWRRTYTIGSEDEKSSDAISLSAPSGEEDAPVKLSKPKKEKKHSLSLWKRSNSQEDNEDKDKALDSMKMPPPKKKGFSLWRRDNKKIGVDSDVVKKRPEPPQRLEGSSLPVATVKSTPNHSPTVTDGKSGISVGSPLTSPNKPPNAAIIAPYNYNPNQKALHANIEEYISQEDDQPPPSKHMTKTEMLLARRQTYLNNLNKDKENDDGKDGKRPCLVTTV